MRAMKRSRVGLALIGAMAGVGLLAVSVASDRNETDSVPPAVVSATPDVSDPLSAVIAVRYTGVPAGFPANSAPALLPVDAGMQHYVKALVAHANTNYNFATNTWASGTVPKDFVFPLANSNSDDSRQLAGLTRDIVAKWLDPITSNGDGPRFGANSDYNAYFGDGWDTGVDGKLGSSPQWSGQSHSGYLWTNFEYVSGSMPTTTSAPTDQHLILAKFLAKTGVLAHNVASNVWAQADVDTYVKWYKKQVGGGFVHVVKDATGQWCLDLAGTFNRRFDASSDTQLLLTGGGRLSILETTDGGAALATGVIPGLMANCSGGTSPWGTVFTCEENSQEYYGDIEPCWNSSQKFTSYQGFDAGGRVVPPCAASVSSDFGRSAVPAELHGRDGYGWVAEIDPECAADDHYDAADGRGHRKLSMLGRFRHENATFVTGTDFKLVPNQPIVIYTADDRRSGGIYKFVSSNKYTADMTRAQVRALLDSGKLYVAHFTDLHNDTGRTVGTGTTRGGITITSDGNATVPTEASPGHGVWIELSVNNSTQQAPNAGASVPAGHSLINRASTRSSLPELSVGAALKDDAYNGIGGFPNDNLVRACAFTAAAKIGIRELNRPEDVEWNPFGHAGGNGAAPRLYIAFTNHNSRTCNDLNGVMLDPADDHAATIARNDNDGRIWALAEKDANAATSASFTFWQVIGSSEPLQPSSPFDFSDPDNLMIDADGGLWFGTDGYFGSSDAIGPGRSDAIYYLDTDPRNANSFGRPFRVIAAPGNAEATGPCFTPDMKTLFYSAQHPGELPGQASTFPQPR